MIVVPGLAVVGDDALVLVVGGRFLRFLILLGHQASIPAPLDSRCALLEVRGRQRRGIAKSVNRLTRVQAQRVIDWVDAFAALGREQLLVDDVINFVD